MGEDGFEPHHTLPPRGLYYSITVNASPVYPMYSHYYRIIFVIICKSFYVLILISLFFS
nr:MAG TPA: hypothetical protein [Caudoviricetes sp.]DAW32059.1 MAG TPA: hypothetical protein [Caudoviricetes sp.]